MEKQTQDAIASHIGAAIVPLLQAATDKNMIRDLIREEIAAQAPRRLEIIDATGAVKKIGLAHKHLEKLVRALGASDSTGNRLNVWLCGPAGTGKTKAAEQAAEALSCAFYTMSVCAQTSKADLLGYQDAQGRYVETAFYKAYKDGGVFLLDEIDNGNANVLNVLNAATSNGGCLFGSVMVTRHADFRLVAAANTYGLGADSVYVGRCPIDAATRDRFVFLDWPIDDELEAAICGHNEWLNAVRRFRAAVEKCKIKAMITPRASFKGAAMIAAGFGLDQVVESCLNAGLSKESLERIKTELERAK